MTTEKTELAKPEELTLSALRPAGDENAIFFDKDLFAQAQRAAELLSKSQMIPDQYRNKMPDCFIALASANRMNVDVFAFMQNSYIVHGRPGIEAKLVIAMVNSRGPFDGPIQWKMEGEGNSRQCTAYARHAQTKELCESTVTWAMVEAEGWNEDTTIRSGKNAGKVMKSKWNTLPDLMFRYRSATFLARLYCPEVILGITTVDELQDIQMTVAPDGIYEKEEEHSSTLPTEDLFHKEFIHHKHAVTVAKITGGVTALAKKFEVSEEEIKKTALDDPDAFRTEIKGLETTTPPSTTTNPVSETSGAQNEEETPPSGEEDLPPGFGEELSEKEKEDADIQEKRVFLEEAAKGGYLEDAAKNMKKYVEKLSPRVQDAVAEIHRKLKDEEKKTNER